MAILTNITGRILVQVGDADPVEVGTIEIPVTVTEPSQKIHPRDIENHYAR
ncbi:MAG: hypothetical protein L0G87_16410 [Renibacterium salmoninarum]|nr:hypothetical protein [Renibacterium salmoninarum]